MGANSQDGIGRDYQHSTHFYHSSHSSFSLPCWEGAWSVRGLGGYLILSENNSSGIRVARVKRERRDDVGGGEALALPLRPDRRLWLNLATYFLMQTTCGIEQPILGTAESDTAGHREP
jgi:hypothetical protein